MNILEQKHYDAIEDRKVISDKHDIETFRLVPLGSPERCAQLTKNIAIAYQEWYEDEVLTWGEIYGIQRSEKYLGKTDDELFNLFIEETYK